MKQYHIPDASRQSVRRWTQLHERRRYHFLRAALVGLLAGSLAVFFQWSLYLFEEGRNLLLHWLLRRTWILVIFFPLIMAVMAGLAGWMTQRFAPETAGSGIPHVKAVLLRMRTLHWRRVIPVKYIGSLLSIGSGLSLGREGPTVQMGAAAGEIVGEMLHVPARARNHLIACGCGAGLAAAFNAPLAGFIFVIEEFQRNLSPLTYSTAFIAAVTADVVTRLFTGQLPSFHIQGYPLTPLSALPLFALLGMAAGFTGFLFNKSLLWSATQPKWFKKLPRWLRAALIAAVAGCIGIGMPSVLGGGHHTAEAILTGQYSSPDFLGFVILLFFLKFVLTIGSYGAGVPGGIFAPMLVLGALLGNTIGHLAGLWFPVVASNPAAFTVAGMAAFFTASVRAPLTGIVLILEMTANYDQLFALLVTCLVSHLTAEAFKQRPIYDALLAIDLRQAKPVSETTVETFLIDLIVEPESIMANKKIKQLALPMGALLVNIKRFGVEFVPHGHTVLRPGDEITIVIDSGNEQIPIWHKVEQMAKAAV